MTWGVVVCLAVGGPIGCGYRRPRLAQVTGVVTLDGEPVAGASVSFTPIAGGRQANGGTDAKGIFFLSSYASRDGAMLGKHRVSVTKLVLTPAAEKRLRQREATGKAAADEEAAETPPIDPQPSDYRNLLPARYSDPATSGLEVEVSHWIKPITLELRSDAAVTR